MYWQGKSLIANESLHRFWKPSKQRTLLVDSKQLEENLNNTYLYHYAWHTLLMLHRSTPVSNLCTKKSHWKQPRKNFVEDLYDKFWHIFVSCHLYDCLWDVATSLLKNPIIGTNCVFSFKIKQNYVMTSTLTQWLNLQTDLLKILHYSSFAVFHT